MGGDFSFYLVMAVSVAVLGISKGGFAGVGMVSTPMVAVVADPISAAVLMLPIMLVQDLVAVCLYRRDFEIWILKVMLPGGLLGVLMAYLFASFVPDWGVRLLLGGISLVFSIWQFTGILKRTPQVKISSKLDRFFGVMAGVAGGFASSIAHAGAPPYQVYVMPKKLTKELYVGTSVMFFAALNLMKLPSFIALGVFDRELLLISACFVPMAAFFSWLGAWLVKRTSADKFNLLTTVVLLIVSCALIVQALYLG